MNLLARWMHPRHARTQPDRRAIASDRPLTLPEIASSPRRVDRVGYVRVSIPGSRGRWQYEHRLVMEAVLRRFLHRGEVVHHRNHNKSDNRADNLELMPIGRHVALHNHLSAKRHTAKGTATNGGATHAHGDDETQRCGKQ